MTRAEIVRSIARGEGRISLTGADLSGLDLSGLMLNAADLSYCDMTGADLSDAQLVGASLWSIKAARAQFRRANLAHASMGLAMLDGADLRGAALDDADLTGAQLSGADLTGATLAGVWLDTMQRALATGAPPLHFAPAPGTHRREIAEADIADIQAAGPIALHCGDRLDIRLHAAPHAVHVDAGGGAGAQLVAQMGGAHALAAGCLLSFVAVLPGRARLVLRRARGGALIILDVEVSR